ncbi:MAG: 23S rRNA (uracil(1939)-C(5))-methyltransferase RlmD, partial [Firmicutes bacterium]|nr:23S rRNA (uracil(1939)-C(5))-methyltransferase RlmD [Candidatus Colivicinus equi]
MKNQIVYCECIDMSVDGQGIAKAGDLVVFVKGMIVGETADVKIIAEKKNYAFGIIDKLIKRSEYRIDSDCPISYKCGGCDYRYIDYNYQLVLKKKVLVNTFRDYHVEDILPCEDYYYYRNKVQIPVKEDKMGFYRKFSNDIVEFDDCKIESKLANEIINYLRPFLLEYKLNRYLRHILIKHCQGTDEVMIGFIVNDFKADFSNIVELLVIKFSNIKSIILNLNDRDTNVILGTKEKVLYGNSYVYDIYDGIKVKLSLKSFYQVNYHQMLKLYALVKKMANPSPDDEVLDLYCGIGTISLYMARYVKHVTGVEIVSQAIENAKDNSSMNGINNCDFVLADASKGMDQYIKGKDIVIVDPPRKGISKELIESFIKNKTKKIVYVSCNPATLARDLDLLKDYYDVDKIHPVDMFPMTVHV